MEWYKKDGTLYQYILGRNATSGTDDGATSHILINPAYNTSKHTYDTDEGLIIGKNTFVYYNKSIFHTGNYKDLIVTNGLNAPITITNTTATPAAKTDLPILKIRYQNTGGTYYTVDAISAIGTGETGTTINNGCLRMGATSGSLALTAGECGKNMITKHSLTNTENIYLLTDAGVEFYVGCSNDAATSTKALTITSSSGVSPGANNSITLGTSSLKWSNVYATTFNGNLIADHVGNGSNYIAFPKGGKYSTTNSRATGFLNITLPFGKNNTMLRFKISIYNYVTNSSVDYYVGGYTYSDGNWHQTFAYSIGNPVSAIGNLPVIFGHTADGKGCIQIGSSTTTWSYPQVTISEVIIGYSGGTYSTWANGTWAIGFTTTALAAPISTLTNPRIGGAIIYKVSG